MKKAVGRVRVGGSEGREKWGRGKGIAFTGWSRDKGKFRQKREIVRF